MERTAPFPDAWRKTCDELPGVRLPAASRKPEARSAADFLAARFERPGARILALGPLTNLAEALRHVPRADAEVVIMGGAIRVPGNLGDGGFFRTNNTEAEWNIFHDPAAARIVFESGPRMRLIRLIPLDATNRVPID